MRLLLGTLVLETDDDLLLQEPTPLDDGPLRDDQRRALFASFSQVFGAPHKPVRDLFTRMILGKDVDAPVSWSTWANGTITAAEASRLLDVLDACERTQIAADDAAA